MGKKKRWIIFVVVIILISMLPLLNLVDFSIKDKPLLDSEVLKSVIEVNKGLPKMVDSEIRADSVNALPNNIFQYNFTLINYSKGEMNLDEVRKQFYSEILNKLRMNVDMKMFKDNKTTLIYLFNDKNGYEIVKLTYPYNDYK